MAKRKDSNTEQGPEERRTIDRTPIEDREAYIEFPGTGGGGFSLRRSAPKSLVVTLVEFSPRGASIHAPFQFGVDVGTEVLLHVAGGVARGTVKSVNPNGDNSCRYGVVFLTVDTYLREFINDVRTNPDAHDYRWLYRSA